MGPEGDPASLQRNAGLARPPSIRDGVHHVHLPTQRIEVPALSYEVAHARAYRLPTKLALRKGASRSARLGWHSATPKHLQERRLPIRQRVPEPLPRLARLDLKVNVINALAIVSCPFNGSQRPSATYLPKKVWNKLFVAPKHFAPTKHAKHTTVNFIITPTKLHSSLLVMGNKIKINCIEKLLEVSL
jgi:hypothetical protein